MKQILEVEESTMIHEDTVRSWYQKSHNHYEPSEQIAREWVLCQLDVNKLSIADQANTEFETDWTVFISEISFYSYKKSFDKCIRFGKPPRNQESKSRIRRILTWINHEPVTLVNRQQADFIERTRSFVGQVK